MPATMKSLGLDKLTVDERVILAHDLWYETVAAGLGVRFDATVERVVRDLAADPVRYPPVHRDIRCAPVPGFPAYGVYYRVRPGRLVVISVFHTSRDPAVWQSRS